MNPDKLIDWAVCIGVAWIILVSLTGADEWLKSLFGRKSQTQDLEERIAKLEQRLNEAEKK
jgi:hypothetical protein